MFLYLLALPAIAAPPADAKVTATENDCTFYALPKNKEGVSGVHVHCEWPELTVVRLDELLRVWGDQDDYFGTVAVSEEISKSGEVARVYQKHVVAGISDREVTLDMTREAIDKGYRYRFTKSEKQEDPRESGTVNTEVDDGAWTVVALPRGGVTVYYDLLYDPGGWVPGFVIRWFQTSGIITILGELRTRGNAG